MRFFVLLVPRVFSDGLRGRRLGNHLLGKRLGIVVDEPYVRARGVRNECVAAVARACSRRAPRVGSLSFGPGRQLPVDASHHARAFEDGDHRIGPSTVSLLRLMNRTSARLLFLQPDDRSSNFILTGWRQG